MDHFVQGQTVANGRYRLDKLLGSGSQAQVWKAHMQDGTNQPVVLKFNRLLTAITARQEARNKELHRLFRNEARLAAKLHHPNIVSLFDVGQEGPYDFIALEYVNGHDLSQVLDAYQTFHKGPIPWELATQLAVQICEGLDYAHNQRDEEGEPLDLVHRDLKPQNILLSHDGFIKIIDFGIAKARSNVGRTKTGATRGTPHYMAPEQIQDARKIDARADLFSLGVLLYELLAGVRPFESKNLFALFAAIVNNPSPTLPPLDHPPPQELVDLIEQLLAKDAAERPLDAQEVLTRLTQTLPPHSISKQPLVSLYKKMFGAPDMESSTPKAYTEAFIVGFEPESDPLEDSTSSMKVQLQKSAGEARLSSTLAYRADEQESPLFETEDSLAKTTFDTPGVADFTDDEDEVSLDLLESPRNKVTDEAAFAETLSANDTANEELLQAVEFSTIADSSQAPLLQRSVLEPEPTDMDLTGPTLPAEPEEWTPETPFPLGRYIFTGLLLLLLGLGIGYLSSKWFMP